MLQPFGQLKIVEFLEKDCSDEFCLFYLLAVHEKGRIMWRFRNVEVENKVKDISISAASKTSF